MVTLFVIVSRQHRLSPTFSLRNRSLLRPGRGALRICTLSASESESFLFPSNLFRITFFAHPHPLSPLESYSCKKGGWGGRAWHSPPATSSNSEISATPIPSYAYAISQCAKKSRWQPSSACSQPQMQAVKLANLPTFQPANLPTFQPSNVQTFKRSTSNSQGKPI